MPPAVIGEIGGGNALVFPGLFAGQVKPHGSGWVGSAGVGSGEPGRVS